MLNFGLQSRSNMAGLLKFDKPVLYLVTDSALLPDGASLNNHVEAAIKGGVSIVQFRDKFSSSKELARKGLDLLAICQASHIPLIINDRVDIALAIGANG